MNKRRLTRLPRRLLLAALAASSATFASAQITSSSPVVSGSNIISVLGSTSTTLNGFTFVNQGLVGVGNISATQLDAFGETYGSVSGLQLLSGSWAADGSGGYTGSFVTLPDRGYNATTFSNYAARVEQVDFTFNPYYGAAPVPQNQLQFTYNAAGSAKFTYDTASGPTTTTGLVPDSSTTLAGKTVPYVTISNGLPGLPASGGSTVNKISLDAEALVLLADGSGYVSDEYGPNIYRFNAAKEITGVITPPAAIIPHLPAGTPNFSSEVSNTNGRRGNQGLEGLALSADGTKLYALAQSATIQDSGSGNQGRVNTRLLVYDVSTNAVPSAPVSEYVIRLPSLNDTGAGSPNRTAAQSEIVVVDATRILVLSRDGNGKGAQATGAPVFKSILLVDLAGGTNIAGTPYDLEGGDITPSGITLAPGITPLAWTEAVNLLNAAQLAKFGLNLKPGSAADANSISEKWEGLALVSALDPSAPNDYFLFVANDNDFISRATTMLQPDGTYATIDALAANPAYPENDTTFLAYRVTLVSPIPEPAAGAAVLASAALLALRLRRKRR